MHGTWQVLRKLMILGLRMLRREGRELAVVRVVKPVSEACCGQQVDVAQCISLRR